MKESVRIIFFSDSHLGFDYPIKPKKKKPRRGEDFFRNHETVFQYALDNKADLVLHGGDFFFRTKIPKLIEAKSYDSLLDFAGEGIPIVIVPGNHESSRLPGSLLIQHPNIHVIEKPKNLQFSIRGIRVSITGFPFVREKIRYNFKNIINKTDFFASEPDIKILLMHQIVYGAVVGPGNYTFRNGEDVIRKKDLPDGFDCYLSGHIHRQQIIDIRKNGKIIPFIYTGSIERTSFAEKDEKKGFFDLTFVPDVNSSGLKKISFIELPARPMIDLILKGNGKKELINNFTGQLKSVPGNSIIRVTLKNPEMIKYLNAKVLRENAPENVIIKFKGKIFKKPGKSKYPKK